MRQRGCDDSGTASGQSLIFNAHMDTGPELGPKATEDEKKLETAWVDGDMLFGKGMINDKAQLCAFIVAMGAIKKAASRLMRWWEKRPASLSLKPSVGRHGSRFAKVGKCITPDSETSWSA
jgi:hypothetical protein